MKSRLAATALVTLSASALALGACTMDGGSTTTTPGGKAAGDGNYTIAVVPKDAHPTPGSSAWKPASRSTPKTPA